MKLQAVQPMLRMAAVAIVCFGGCAMPSAHGTSNGEVTQQMRDACPMLSDEVIEGFIAGMEGLRDNGLSEADALELWVDGCEDIPPDGNFQGDIEACRACLPVILEGVYATN